MESENHRISWAGRGLKEHPVPATLAMDMDTFTRTGCSELWLTWPGTL